MLTVITPATATALTTITRAREILGFNTFDDTAAATLIRQASQVIVDYCRRPFGLETVRETFVDNDLCGDGPMLSRDPVVEVLSVSSNGATLPAGDYRPDERTGRLRRIDADGRPLPWWGGALTVQYRAGYVLPPAADATPAGTVTLPESIERAAIAMLSTYLGTRGRDPNVKAETIEGIGSTSWWVPGSNDQLASTEAEQLLGPYRRFWP